MLGEVTQDIRFVYVPMMYALVLIYAREAIKYVFDLGEPCTEAVSLGMANLLSIHLLIRLT